jgi:signal transduction histidine kinase/ligand-binding sensor domain-containing protein
MNGLLYRIVVMLCSSVPLYAVVQHVPVYIPQAPTQKSPQGLNPAKPLKHFIHRQWRTEQGLPQNSAQALCQTRDGYLWIGTEEGLVRFDGTRFTVFDAEHTDGLHANTIQALMEDHTGALWIGTSGGGVSRYKNGVFTAFNTANGLANNFVSSIIEDRTVSSASSTDTAVAVWIGTLGGGVSRFHNGHFTTLSTNEGLTHNLVFTLAQDRTGTLWIGTNGGGVNCYRNGTLTALTTANGLCHNLVRALCEDRAGGMWIGTFGGGVQHYHNGTFTTFTTQHGLADNLVWSLCQDALGTLWIGTFGGGLNRCVQGKFQRFSSANGLSSDLVRSVFADREGALWVGTVGGLNRFTDGAFTTFTTDDGLPHNVVRAVLERRFKQDASNSTPNAAPTALWIGTFGGGVGAWRNAEDNTAQFSNRQTLTTQQGLSNAIVYTLLEDRLTGALWIGTNGGGLNRWLNGTVTTFTTRNGLANDVVFALMQDRTGALWVGTSGGVNRVTNGALTPVPTATTMPTFTTRNGLSNNNVRVLLEDRTGAVWMGTVGGGLNRYKDGVFTVFTTKNGLSSDNIRALYEDSEGTLWIGTNGGGLNRYKDGVFTAFTTKQGLFNDVVHTVQEDELGYMWMSCNKGVFRVRKQDLERFAARDTTLRTLSCDVFGTADGMVNAECNSGNPAGYKDRSGALWFATMTGVVTVDPRSAALHASHAAPTVIIEAIYADSLRVALMQPSVLPPTVQKFEFHYTATSLSAPERVRFRYMLEGYDAAWVEAGTRRSAYYTNLPRGRTYRFRVLASTHNGVWQELGETGASAQFRLSSYVWERWWFYGLCGLSVVAIAMWLYRLRVRQLHRRAEQLETTIALRTSELRESNEEIQRHLEQLDEQAREIELSNTELRAKNLQLEALHTEKDEFLGIAAHDLKNPLTSIAFAASFIRRFSRESPAERMIEEQVAKIETLTQRMTAIISNFLDVNALESGAVQFHIEPFDIAPTVHAIVEEYQLKAATKALTIQTDLENALPLVLADKQVTEEILDNLLSNALKFSPQDKTVTLRVYAHAQTVRLAVQDEGPGISVADMVKLFGKFARLSAQPTGGEHSTGLGLSIVKKLVEAMRGRVWCESELGKGATFVVELPSAESSAIHQHPIS